MAAWQLAGLDPVIFSDFDGTITQADVTDRILEELANPSWREVEDLWVRGLIGSRECLARQIALVNASRSQLNALIDSITLDTDFRSFYSFTRQHGIPFYVVSDGFDYVIRRILKRAGVDGELRNGRHIFASSLSLSGNRLAASFCAPDCSHGCATCKPAAMRQAAREGQAIIFIGDGLSDRFAVEEADVVFAKKQLLEHCRSHDIACQSFETFADIQASLCDLAPGHEAEEKKVSRKGAKAQSRKAAGLAPVGEVR